MSAALKVIIAIIIIGGLGWLAWYSGWINGPTGQPAAQQQQATTTPQQEQPNTNGMSAASDTSDAALQQDSAAVDTQMQGLTQDSAAIDSSLNDKPVQQAY